MINMDKPEYRRLARLILEYRQAGNTWHRSQQMALTLMDRRHGWRP